MQYLSNSKYRLGNAWNDLMRTGIPNENETIHVRRTAERVANPVADRLVSARQ